MKSLLAVAFIVLLSVSAFSQALFADTTSALSSQTRRLPKHHFSIHLRQLAELEARLGYERMLGNRQAIGLQLAYKPDLHDVGFVQNLPGDHTDETYYATTSYSLFVNYKYFVVKNPNSYIRPFVEADGMGRYMEYKDKRSAYASKESASQVESGEKIIYGCGLTLGSRFYLNRKKSLFLDVFGGLSGRITYLSTQVKPQAQESVNKYEKHTAQGMEKLPLKTGVFLEGSPQIGATFGVSF